MFGKMKGLFNKENQDMVLLSPLEGTVVAAGKISDPTFGSELLGKTIGILPTGGRIVSPVSGVVDSVFDTGHAVTVISDQGTQIIIHVGLDTVNLQGKHFTIHAKGGDKVKPGDLLLEFNKEGIEADGYDSITAVIICNSGEYSQIDASVDVAVKEGDPIMTIKK